MFIIPIRNLKIRENKSYSRNLILKSDYIPFHHLVRSNNIKLESSTGYIKDAKYKESFQKRFTWDYRITTLEEIMISLLSRRSYEKLPISVLKVEVEIILENWDLIQNNLESPNKIYIDSSKKFNRRLIDDSGKFRSGYYSSMTQTLYDYKNMWIPYSFVIKRDYIEIFKYNIILGLEQDPDGFEFLVDPLTIKRGNHCLPFIKKTVKALSTTFAEKGIKTTPMPNILNNLYNVVSIPQFGTVDEIKAYISQGLDEYIHESYQPIIDMGLSNMDIADAVAYTSLLHTYPGLGNITSG